MQVRQETAGMLAEIEAASVAAQAEMVAPLVAAAEQAALVELVLVLVAH